MREILRAGFARALNDRGAIALCSAHCGAIFHRAVHVPLYSYAAPGDKIPLGLLPFSPLTTALFSMGRYPPNTLQLCPALFPWGYCPFIRSSHFYFLWGGTRQIRCSFALLYSPGAIALLSAHCGAIIYGVVPAKCVAALPCFISRGCRPLFRSSLRYFPQHHARRGR